MEPLYVCPDCLEDFQFVRFEVDPVTLEHRGIFSCACAYNLTRENIERGKFKECLEYHLGNCKAPCIGNQSEADY
ncbi:MAG: hypothetical protein R6V10_15340, partial [bacterium]